MWGASAWGVNVWACMGPKFAQPELPVMLLLILKYLASELKRERTTSCRSDPLCCLSRASMREAGGGHLRGVPPA